MRRRIALLATAALALAAGTIAAVGSPASAAAGCAATYTVTNSWPGGFQATLSVTNLGDPLTSWRVGFAFPDAAQRVSSGWNGRWSQTGSTVTVTNEAWNAALATNGTVVPAFVGVSGAANPKPSTGRIRNSWTNRRGCARNLHDADAGLGRMARGAALARDRDRRARAARPVAVEVRG